MRVLPVVRACARDREPSDDQSDGDRWKMTFRPGSWLGLALQTGAAVLALGCHPRAPVPQPLPAAQPTAVASPRPVQETGADSWPVLLDDLDMASLSRACSAAVEVLQRRDPDQLLVIAGETWRVDELTRGMERICRALVLSDDPAERNKRLRECAVLFRSERRDGTGEALVTGYYEPQVSARRQRAPGYEVPLHGLPDDLVVVDLERFGRGPGRLVGRVRNGVIEPYPDRLAIDFGGALGSRAPVLAYVRDRIEAFTVHVEGSAVLEMGDGSKLRLSYAGSNGRPYRSIGKYLVRQQLMKPHEVSMDRIRTFLQNHPDRIEEVLGHNPSYVFFMSKPAAATDGPPGCFGVPLVAGRSIALDRSLFPAPVLAHLTASLPAVGGGEEQVSRFVVMLDTGSAIRGPGRADLYFGTGAEAALRAGRTKSRGQLWLLLPQKDRASDQR